MLYLPPIEHQLFIQSRWSWPSKKPVSEFFYLWQKWHKESLLLSVLVTKFLEKDGSDAHPYIINSGQGVRSKYIHMVVPEVTLMVEEFPEEEGS